MRGDKMELNPNTLRKNVISLLGLLVFFLFLLFQRKQ